MRKFTLTFSINKNIWKLKLFKLIRLKILVVSKKNSKKVWLKKLKTLFKVHEKLQLNEKKEFFKVSKKKESKEKKFELNL